MMIFLERLNDTHEKNMMDVRMGFRKNRSTVDDIFTVKRIISSTNEPLYAVFVNLQGAYNHIDNKMLMKLYI